MHLGQKDQKKKKKEADISKPAQSYVVHYAIVKRVEESRCNFGIHEQENRLQEKWWNPSTTGKNLDETLRLVLDSRC